MSNQKLTGVRKMVDTAIGIVFPDKELNEILVDATKDDAVQVISEIAKLYQKELIEKGKDAKLTPLHYERIRFCVDVLNERFARRVDLLLNYDDTMLYEKQDVVCPVCGSKMPFKKGEKFNLYFCANGCDVMVSCHPHTALPAAIPATSVLRKMRKELHDLTDKVFRGSRTNLYRFISRMIEREFNDIEGHIGSMNETECRKVLNLFYFLQERGEFQKSIRDVSSRDYLLEENFLSHATHKELQAYYVLVKNDFSSNDVLLKWFSDMDKEDISEILMSALSKGLPLSRWANSSSEFSREVVFLVNQIQDGLFRTLESHGTKRMKRIAFF